MECKIFYILFAFILAAELQLASCQQDSSALPVTYSATLLDGLPGEQVCPAVEQQQLTRDEIGQSVLNMIRNDILCPGQVQTNPAASCLAVFRCNAQLPSKYYWIRSSDGSTVQVYCDMTRECSCNGTTFGGWSRVAYLDMRDPTQQCPPAWREITDPVRTCGRTNESIQTPLGVGGCSSASFSSYGISYSSVCGRIVAYQLGVPDQFLPHSLHNLEDPYVDGIIISRGTEQQHVWTFAVGISEDDVGGCNCSDGNTTYTFGPPFVGEDYFCESGSKILNFAYIFYQDDPLWDGKDCGGIESECCEFNNPPYFCKSFPEPTTDDIEVTICGDQPLVDEDTPIQLMEIYVQ